MSLPRASASSKRAMISSSLFSHSSLLGQDWRALIAFIFEMLHASMKTANPKFATLLTGTIADERRHVGFGESRIGSLIAEHPEKKADVQKMQKEMSP